jgi:hypothetical protein
MILTFEDSIQWAQRMLVVLLRCMLMPEIMHKGAPEIFLYQLNWKVAI